jgi:hypothetical protein
MTNAIEHLMTVLKRGERDLITRAVLTPISHAQTRAPATQLLLQSALRRLAKLPDEPVPRKSKQRSRHALGRAARMGTGRADHAPTDLRV